MVKTIRFKTEIFKVNEKEMNLLDRVCRALVLKDGGVELKYRKYSRLDLSNIKQIVAPDTKLEAVPEWVRECKNLTQLNLDKNRIR